MPQHLNDVDCNVNKILEALTWLEFCSDKDATDFADTLRNLYTDSVEEEMCRSRFDADISMRLRSLVTTFAIEFRTTVRKFYTGPLDS